MNYPPLVKRLYIIRGDISLLSYCCKSCGIGSVLLLSARLYTKQISNRAILSKTTFPVSWYTSHCISRSNLPYISKTFSVWYVLYLTSYTEM